jgi:hypothetical protein
MGAGKSRTLEAPSLPVFVFGQQDEHTSDMETLLVMKEQMLDLQSPDDHDLKISSIRDHTGNVLYRLDGHSKDPRDPCGRYIRDLQNRPLCFISQQSFAESGRPAWHLYDTLGSRRRVTIEQRLHNFDGDLLIYVWLLPIPDIVGFDAPAAKSSEMQGHNVSALFTFSFTKRHRMA